MSKDSVCGANVNDNSPHRSRVAGQAFMFCGPECKAKFDEEPGRYGAATPAGAGTKSGSATRKKKAVAADADAPVTAAGRRAAANRASKA